MGQQYLIDPLMAAGTSGIIHPGINSLPKGQERYPLKAGGMLVVDLRPGDELNIVDPEGLQPCEVAVFDESGKCQPDALQHNCATVNDGKIIGVVISKH